MLAYFLTANADEGPYSEALKDIESALPGKLLNNPFESDWNIRGDAGLKQKVVEAADIPGGAALQLRSKKRSQNAWDAEVSVPLDFAVEKNETIHLAFWAREVKKDKAAKKSAALVRISQNIDPYAAIISKEFEFSEQWNLYQIQGQATQNFSLGMLEFVFQMGKLKQTIELGQFYVLKVDQQALQQDVVKKCKQNPEDCPINNTVAYPANNTSPDYYAGAEYSLVWADEFNETRLNEAFWNRQVVAAGKFNEEWQRYTSSNENAYIDNGFLVLKANHESTRHGHDQYTSARVNTANKVDWKYGKIVARMQLPYGKGIWPAFWMLGGNIDEHGGNTPWPQSGEIDIFELYGSNNDAVVEGNIHYANSDGKHQFLEPFKYELESGKFADNFHIFELQWDASSLTWLVDGKAFKKIDITDKEMKEFHQQFFILFNIAVGGTWAGRPDHTTPFPQYMYIDWVRVYQKQST